MTISITDNTAENISDPELYESKYMLMHEAISKGKNVKIRARSMKL